ncbi:MAG: hypothetical protein MUO67_03520 [Anaerolineales bacterium]|nr:hypothetical protein [Anaerolineales bacterium]
MDKKRHLNPIIIAMIVFTTFLVGTTVVQAQGLVEATLSAEGENLTVGDPIKLTLSVTHAADQTVILPQLESNWGDFIVHSQAPAETVTNADGTKTTSQVIDVRLFAPGTFTTPPLPITISDSSGQLSEVIAPPASLIINSVLVEGDTELRDIKPQAELPYTNLLPWIIGGILIAGALGSAALWMRRRQSSLAQGAIDNRLPHEVALDELERIGKLRLPESGHFKEHYTLVSDCIRVYIERTFQIPVLERTTSEIRYRLKSTAIQPDVSQLIVFLLDESDLVKFSKFTPDTASAIQLLVTGRQIVTATKPIVETTSDRIEEIGRTPSDPDSILPTKNRNQQPTEVSA